MKGKNKYIVLVIIIVILVGAAGFFGGMQYQKSQATTFRGQFAGVGGTRGQGNIQGRTGTAQRNLPVSGEIISQDDTSITVKMQDGSTKIVILADNTTFNKSSTGAKSDLKKGEKVTAIGTTNSDGSITAQMVSLGNNMFRGGMPGGARMQGTQQGTSGGQQNQN